MIKSKKTLILIIVMVVLAFLLAVYIGGAVYFNSHFFPGTTVNEKSYSFKTAEYLKNKNVKIGENYILTIYDSNENRYILQGMDFSYAYVDSGAEEELMESQNSFAWLFEVGKKHAYTMDESFSYDEDELEKNILALAFLNSEEYTESENAELVLSDDGEYVITPEVYGNEPIADEVVNTIIQAVSEGMTECTLSESCYVQPEVTSDDEILTQALKKIQSYLNASIDYEIEGEDESLSSEEIAEMLVIDADYSVSVDTDKITSFVQTLATKYNTYGDVRSFETTEGDTIEIGGGDYGWVIDKSGEAEQIMEDLEGGEPVTREPVYEQTAQVSGLDDIGDTYIELDYTNQHLYYYEDGKLVLDSDIVSGRISNGNGSPDGIFKIVYKQSPATLVGEDYESDVTYFMPFAYNVGIHDASWRSEFGGSIYVNAGSHGCINVPKETAEELYEVLETGTPVVAYYRDEVELTSESSKISNAYSYVDKDEE